MRTLAILLGLAVACHAAAAERLPVFDVHLHAATADSQGPPPLAMCTPLDFPAWDPARPYAETFFGLLKAPRCPDPIWSPETDEELLRRTVAVMERNGVVGLLMDGSVERLAAWRAAAPGRFLPSIQFQVGPDAPTPEALLALHGEGAIAALGEVTNQYAGIEPDDPRMEPYWALAERLDLPVSIHLGTGPPGVIYLGASGYRARMHSALTIEEVLVRHPRLRVILGHAGYPLLDDLLAVLYAHPQVHVDVGVIVYTQPRAAFYRYLEAIVDAGFVERVLFGSDQMVWPEAIERSIRVVEEAPFLSGAQKRAILYDNAARFFRLSDEEIARHHALAAAAAASPSRTLSRASLRAGPPGRGGPGRGEAGAPP